MVSTCALPGIIGDLFSLDLATLKQYHLTLMSVQGFASRLRAARAGTNYTQYQVAISIGCTSATIANYERGRTEPPLVILRRLAALYGVTLVYLVAGAPGAPGVKVSA